jgi:hypothetical protein
VQRQLACRASPTATGNSLGPTSRPNRAAIVTFSATPLRISFRLNIRFGVLGLSLGRSVTICPRARSARPACLVYISFGVPFLASLSPGRSGGWPTRRPRRSVLRCVRRANWPGRLPTTRFMSCRSRFRPSASWPSFHAASRCRCTDAQHYAAEERRESHAIEHLREKETEDSMPSGSGSARASCAPPSHAAKRGRFAPRAAIAVAFVFATTPSTTPELTARAASDSAVGQLCRHRRCARRFGLPTPRRFEKPPMTDEMMNGGRLFAWAQIRLKPC